MNGAVKLASIGSWLEIRIDGLYREKASVVLFFLKGVYCHFGALYIDLNMQEAHGGKGKQFVVVCVSSVVDR